MNRLLAQSWWMLAWRGAAALILGILALMWPGISLLVLIALFASFSLLSGAASIASAIRHRGTEKGWWLPLLLGLVSIVAGAIAILNPEVTIFILVLIMAAHAVVTGVLDIAMAIRLRKEIEHEWLLVLTGAVAILFGVVIFLFPPVGVLTLALMVGIYAAAIGILLLALAFQTRKWAKHASRHEQPRAT